MIDIDNTRPILGRNVYIVESNFTYGDTKDLRIELYTHFELGKRDRLSAGAIRFLVSMCSVFWQLLNMNSLTDGIRGQNIPSIWPRDFVSQ